MEVDRRGFLRLAAGAAFGALVPAAPESEFDRLCRLIRELEVTPGRAVVLVNPRTYAWLLKVCAEPEATP